MDLHDLLEDFTSHSVEITGIASDSREVKPGHLYVALPSLSGKDSKPFITQALSKGAVVIVAQPAVCRSFDASSALFIASDDPRQSLAQIASRFFREKPAVLAAVTGTNGKTSVAEFARQFWENASHKAASIGTLGVIGAERTHLIENSFASPDTVKLHAILRTLALEGYTHTTLEASSHGLHQHRLDELPFKVAAFTNLSQDHLDYHHTLDQYFQAKTLLFSRVLPRHGIAVLNADVKEFKLLQTVCQKREQTIFSYGEKGETFKILSRKPHPRGQEITLRINQITHDFFFPLIGHFQIMNALGAAGIALATGVPMGQILSTLATLQSVPGRLQRIGTTHAGGEVYVDYAHTPDALEKILLTLRDHTAGKLWVVFGAGGERDELKRPLMGKAARLYADKIIVTDDNPRGESPARIRSEVLEGCPDSLNIGDREEAIQKGIKSLEAGDTLVIAGKGHEKIQIIGDVSYPFNDAAIAASYL